MDTEIMAEVERRIEDERARASMPDNSLHKYPTIRRTARLEAMESLLAWIRERNDSAMEDMHKRSVDADDVLRCDSCGTKLRSFNPREPDGKFHAICDCGEFEVVYGFDKSLHEAAAQAKREEDA
jgi:hypothetical protein